MVNSYDEYFDEPMVGLADVFDSLFLDYKEIIGDFHLTPKEYFEIAYPREDFNEGTVISWILPIKEEIRISNSFQKTLPARKWAHVRNFGEKANDALRRHMENFLKEKGNKSAAPVLTPGWTRIESEKIGHASTWSERHAAFAAGLGTFGLSDGFITEKGIAHRCGSLITELKLKPDERSYNGPYENCLFVTAGKCGSCIEKCPVGAISEEGHDKEACNYYIRHKIMPAVNEKYGVDIPGCGLCQAGVPCEDRVPDYFST